MQRFVRFKLTHPCAHTCREPHKSHSTARWEEGDGIKAAGKHAWFTVLCTGMQHALEPASWTDKKTRPTCDCGCMAPPGAHEHVVMLAAVAVLAASNTGTLPVAISTGACGAPLASIGIGRNTAWLCSKLTQVSKWDAC